MKINWNSPTVHNVEILALGATLAGGDAAYQTLMATQVTGHVDYKQIVGAFVSGALVALYSRMRGVQMGVSLFGPQDPKETKR